MAEDAQKAISIPKEDSSWFPGIGVQFCGRHSLEQQPQVHGIWLVVSCLPAPPSSLLCLATTIPREHADTPLCLLPRAGAHGLFSPQEQELSQRSCFQPTQFFVCFSQQRSASQNPNLIFFKCCINRILECAPFCSYPSSSNDMTICCVFHYNLADGNILFHVNINKGRFDLAQKFQIKRGNFYFKVREGNLLFCAETYQQILVASIYTREKIEICSLLET